MVLRGLKKIGKKIKSLFGGRSRYGAEEFKFEADVSAEQWERLPEPIQKAFFQMRGQLDRVQNNNVELQERVKELQGERHKKEKKKAWEQEQKIKKDQERKKKYIWYEDPNQSIVSAFTGDFFKDNDNRSLTLWVGEVRQKTSGGLGFKFLLTSPKDDVGIWEIPKQPIPIHYYPHIFDTDDFVTDMELGKVPVYIDHDGRFSQPNLRVNKQSVDEVRRNTDPHEKLNEMKRKKKQLDKVIEQAEGEDKKKLEKAREQLKRRIDEFDPEEVEHEADIKNVINVDFNTLLENLGPMERNCFFELYNRWMEERSKAKQAMVTVEKLLSRKKSSDLVATALREGREDALSSLEGFENQLEKLGSGYLDLLAREKRARIDASTAESVIERMTERQKNIEDRIPESGKSDEEQAMAKIEDILENLGQGTRTAAAPAPRSGSSEEEGGESGGIEVRP